jgi:hypothetical protein
MASIVLRGWIGSNDDGRFSLAWKHQFGDVRARVIAMEKTVESAGLRAIIPDNCGHQIFSFFDRKMQETAALQ